MDIKEVLNGNIFKVWAKFIIASVVGVVLNTIYTMVDGIFIGQGVGEVGLAGVNIAWPAVTLVVGIGLMIGIGTSSIIAIYMGKGENKKAEKVLGTGVTLIVCIGVVVTILGLLFRMPIIKLLGATSDTLESALDYYTIIFIIAVPYIFATALNPIVRTDGRPDLSMIMIGIGAIANIVLDWILVMKLGFGVKGAAIATSSISTEMIKGKTIEEALKLKNTDVVNSLGGLPPVKLHCSVLAEEAIHEAIADYYRKEGKMTEEEIKVKCGLKEHHCEHCM